MAVTNIAGIVRGGWVLLAKRKLPPNNFGQKTFLSPVIPLSPEPPSEAGTWTDSKKMWRRWDIDEKELQYLNPGPG